MLSGTLASSTWLIFDPKRPSLFLPLPLTESSQQSAITMRTPTNVQTQKYCVEFISTTLYVWTVCVHTSRSAVAFCQRPVPAPQPAAPQSPPRTAARLSAPPRNRRPQSAGRCSPMEGHPRPQSAAGRCSPMEGYQVRCRWKVPAPQRRMEGPHARTPAGRSLIELIMEGHLTRMEDADGGRGWKVRGQIPGIRNLLLCHRQWNVRDLRSGPSMEGRPPFHGVTPAPTITGVMA
jgi:hypothetical protein